MSLFNKKKDKERNIIEDKQVFILESFSSALTQLCINEMEYIDNLLRQNNINFDFYLMAANTYAYYSSIWMILVKKDYNSLIYEKFETTLKANIDRILFDAIGNDKGVDYNYYIAKFREEIDKAVNIAYPLLTDTGFTDDGFTDAYLLSFLNNNDLFKVKDNTVFRIMTNWVRPVIVLRPKLELVDNKEK